ncbi:hypothetical protein SprV_0301061400 [Sparganum proliferum]
MLGSRTDELKLAVRRGDELSQEAAHTYEMDHESNFAATKKITHPGAEMLAFTHVGYCCLLCGGGGGGGGGGAGAGGGGGGGGSGSGGGFAAPDRTNGAQIKWKLKIMH